MLQKTALSKLRLPGMTHRTRRLLPLAAGLVLLVLVLHFCSSLTITAAGCGGDRNTWSCRTLAADVTDSRHSRPLVDPAVPGGSGDVLRGVDTAVGDFLRDGFGRPGLMSSWRFERDAEDVSMSRRQCMLAFPGLFLEIARAQKRFEKIGIVRDDLARIPIEPGRLRAGMFGGKLHILETNLPAPIDRARALTILHSIDQATNRQRGFSVPNIEFVISVHTQTPDLYYPIWAPDRRADDDKVWVMPHPGTILEEDGPPSRRQPERKKAGAAPSRTRGEDAEVMGNEGEYPAVLATARTQIIKRLALLDAALPQRSKIQRLAGVWRSNDLPISARYKGLLHAADGKPWAESAETGRQTGIAGFDGANETTRQSGVMGKSRFGTHVALSDMCRYAFLAHDDTFSMGLLDVAMMCGSVVVTTRPTWLQPYHGVMTTNTDRLHLQQAVHPAVERWAEGRVGRQNVVLVADDWSDADEKMQALVRYPEVAAQIARNAVGTFRRRYLTTAATACYWREMMLAYSRVSFDAGEGYEMRRLGRGVGFEVFMLLEEKAQMAFDEKRTRRESL